MQQLNPTQRLTQKRDRLDILVLAVFKISFISFAKHKYQHSNSHVSKNQPSKEICIAVKTKNKNIMKSFSLTRGYFIKP